MLTSKQALARFGDPTTEKSMVVWQVPKALQFDHIPKKIYCNKHMTGPLEQALKNVKDRGLESQIRTWDGCFNIRRKRGAMSSSLHSWGLAIDINAAWNGFGKKPTMSDELVACFTDAGFDWGGNWERADGMHFQLARLP